MIKKGIKVKILAGKDKKKMRIRNDTTLKRNI